MSAYASAYPPDTPFDPAYKAFFEQFYAVSDDPGAHEVYVENFTRDAIVIMASRKVVGRDAILALRHSMWEKVASRKHTAFKVFPFGANSNEVMIYGSVTYGLKSGGESSLDWAARAHLVKDDADGRVKMDFYQVYLDTGAQPQAK
ncbi:hypothetical protein IAQ61_011570 [Plenodomus lingam]|uniref:SnoaL-like domain-containing protein n=1 Tax=Leptosphaeria maculans (strain JN3 / isolate v23.1.3 / race Av1-4-5-6-7-8) TaxID=985895 RepID=E5AAG6_LEPMJ|nr:hypothetical protein LEMA_P017870.1 [Plenodomus lingam JN3]KAH9859788.1 hypothetical protein IAQ61_011570 [Plenodomus lingam]CBY00657.1 hypothetical protein LEMA_P017870.1 [Plenodomus lingam JN3]